MMNRRKFICRVCMVGGLMAGAAGSKAQGVGLPDSVKAVAFYAEFPMKEGAKKGLVGIGAGEVSLQLEKKRSMPHGPRVQMKVPKGSIGLSTGVDVRKDKNDYVYHSNGVDTGTYRLMIAKAIDTAGHYSLWSGYVFLPRQQKWKLIATVRTGGEGYITQTTTFSSTGKNEMGQLTYAGVQRSNNSWRTVQGSRVGNPFINWSGEMDSSQRALVDAAQVQVRLQNGSLPPMQHKEGVYYQVREKGTGAPIQVTDTLTVHYKGYLLKDSSVFDQTAPGKTARFPLNRLIRGWQVGLPMINRGGKITLVIPSGLAYGIRTRSPKIPPNSILVFEIESAD